MNPTIASTLIRPAAADDLPRIDEIRALAFAPIFASFRAMLGDELYALVQERDDAAQKDFLVSMMADESVWEMYVVELDALVIAFFGVRLDREKLVGEIGLNAVDPAHTGAGIGPTMYEFALARMRAEGMRAAVVGTGGDPSHAPARRAYEKVGFTTGIPFVWLSRLL